MERQDCGESVNRCMECGEPLIGRSDKKFCGDYCRNAYNNRLHKAERRLMDGINRRLARNYKVLESLGCLKAKLSDVEKQGFARNFFTGCRGFGIYRIYECYDIKYRIVFGFLIKLDI